MLWRKAWIESRVRFLLAAGTIAAASCASVVWHDAIRSILANPGSLDTYATYIYFL